MRGEHDRDLHRTLDNLDCVPRLRPSHEQAEEAVSAFLLTLAISSPVVLLWGLRRVYLRRRERKTLHLANYLVATQPTDSQRHPPQWRPW